jgi:hypothetical protein
LFSDEDWTVTFNMMGRRIITPPMWETFVMFICLEDR